MTLATNRPEAHPDLEPSPGLVSRLRAGESDALGEVYFRYAPSLLRLASHLLGSAADAEEVVQDLFVGLPEALGRYEERARFEGWLRRIAVRLALIRMRAGRRRRETDLAAASGSVVNPADSYHIGEELGRLRPDDRTIVVLKVIEGYSHEEIAELLGIRRNAAEVRYHRALKRLREAMESQ